ncbi:hypothetical protein HZ994_09890 [Akkermansiaceae bacterium]|nr:hypothetical protein HZ994_09890 [Akkermansiaceae bacterium]
MKNLTTVAMVAVLAFGSLLGCNPHARPAESKGSGLGSVEMAVASEVLVQALQKNDFEMIAGKNFQQILPVDTPYTGYEGLVALRDRSAKAPNEFVVGVGPDTVMWFKSHDITGNDAIVEWEAHVQKRITLVERLAADKQ